MKTAAKDDQFSEAETRRRAEAALRAAFNTPPKPQSEMKLGKPRAKPKKSLVSQATEKPGYLPGLILA